MRSSRKKRLVFVLLGMCGVIVIFRNSSIIKSNNDIASTFTCKFPLFAEQCKKEVITIYSSQFFSLSNRTKHGNSDLIHIVPIPNHPSNHNWSHFDIKGALSSRRIEIDSLKGEIKIAIAMAITSKKVVRGRKGQRSFASSQLLTRLPFFKHLMPTFCKTASKGFEYTFYLAYDMIDILFTKRENQDVFMSIFNEYLKTNCNSINVTLRLVQCGFAGKPAWAQNDAAMEAYMDGTDYIYRVNDDIFMVSANWTETFINKLLSVIPTNVGVLGPTGGRKDIFTFEFVHKTHIDIFGFYYPHEFPDWYCDGWISKIYMPSHWHRLKNVTVLHKSSLGQRYHHDKTVSKKTMVAPVIERDKNILQGYLNWTRNTQIRPNLEAALCGLNVIGTLVEASMNENSMATLLRNAQLFKIYLPRWQTRVYITNLSENHSDMNISDRYLNKLHDLGTSIFILPINTINKNTADIIHTLTKDEHVCNVVFLPSPKLISLEEIYNLADFTASSPN